jgi:Flp pilus assembly pilin Flp
MGKLPGIFGDNRTTGQALVEYAVILALVVVIMLIILFVLGPQIGTVFSQISKSIS